MSKYNLEIFVKYTRIESGINGSQGGQTVIKATIKSHMVQNILSLTRFDEINTMCFESEYWSVTMSTLCSLSINKMNPHSYLIVVLYLG